MARRLKNNYYNNYSINHNIHPQGGYQVHRKIRLTYKNQKQKIEADELMNRIEEDFSGIEKNLIDDRKDI